MPATARKMTPPVETGPTRATMLPYGRQSIDEEDISAVVEVLNSNWLTTGPKVGEFESAFSRTVRSKHSVAVSSGTAALHTAMHAAGVGPGDEVIVPTLTFAATSNSILYQGGRPIFVDVDPHTLLIDVEKVQKAITKRTKAIIAVDYAGQPCDYGDLNQIAGEHGITLVADACHSLGGEYRGSSVGTLADLSCFSFHPVKHITTGEGGMITCDDASLGNRMRTFRNHGITTDHHQREKSGSWEYEMVELGFNYRLTDFQCALGITQLSKLASWVSKRQNLAAQYNELLAKHRFVTPLKHLPNRKHAYHLFTVQLDLKKLGCTRNDFYAAMRAENIGVNVHYIPVHLHPYYQKTLGTKKGQCPQAEAAFDRILSLPIFPQMDPTAVQDVCNAIDKVCKQFG